MEALNGLVSNGLAIAFIQPIDVIKTRYQVSNNKPLISVIKNIYKQNGMKGYLRGVGPNLVTYPIFWAFFFQSKQSGIYPKTNLEYVDKFTSSFIAAGIGSAISNPFFVIKTRLHTHNKMGVKYSSLIKGVYKESGYKGFYRGLNATLVNNIKMGFQFPMYEVLKQKTDSVLLSSMVAKAVCSSVFYPLDRLRTIQRNSETKLPLLKTFKNIYRSEGLYGLYRGAIIYNFNNTLSFVIMMYFKELIQENLIDNSYNE